MKTNFFRILKIKEDFKLCKNLNFKLIELKIER